MCFFGTDASTRSVENSVRVFSDLIVDKSRHLLSTVLELEISVRYFILVDLVQDYRCDIHDDVISGLCLGVDAELLHPHRDNGDVLATTDQKY